MNSNQNISIFENPELRKQIAFELMKIVNDFLKENSRIVPVSQECYYTEEEILNHLNDPNVKKYFDLSVKSNEDFKKRQNQKSFGESYLKANGKKPINSRAIAFFENPNNTDEAKIENLKFADKFASDEEFADLTLDMLETVERMNIDEFYNTDYEYLANQSVRNPIDTKVGWNFQTIYSPIKDDNPFLYESMSNFKLMYESSPEGVLTEVYNSVTHLFLPIKMNYPEELVGLMANGGLNELILDKINSFNVKCLEFPNMSTDKKGSYEKETIANVSNGYTVSSRLQKIYEDSETFKTLLNNNVIDNQVAFQKRFYKIEIDKNAPIGKQEKKVILSIPEAIDFDEGESCLSEDVMIEDIPDYIKNNSKDCNEKIRFKADIVRIKNKYQMIIDDPRFKDNIELLSNVKDFLNKVSVLEDEVSFVQKDNDLIDYSLKDDPNYKEYNKEQKKAIYMNKLYLGFKKDNLELFNTVKNQLNEFERTHEKEINDHYMDEIQKTENYIINKKSEELEKAKQEEDALKFIQDKRKDYIGKSFGQMADTTKSILDSMKYTEEEKEAAYPDNLKILLNSKMKDSEKVADLKNEFKKIPEKDKIKDALVCLEAISNYDKKFKNFWFIRKWINQKKYNQMKEQGTQLVNFLKDHRVSMSDNYYYAPAENRTFVNKIVDLKESINVIGGLSRYEYSIKKTLDDYNKNERTINMYQEKLDKIKEEKNVPNEKINKLKDEFFKDYEPAKTYLEKGIIDSYRINEKAYIDDFKDWLKNNKEYENEYNNQMKLIHDIDVKADPFRKKRSECIQAQQNGKLYNPYSVDLQLILKFKDDQEKEKELDVKKSDVAKNDLKIEKGLNQDKQ